MAQNTNVQVNVYNDYDIKHVRQGMAKINEKGLEIDEVKLIAWIESHRFSSLQLWADYLIMLRSTKNRAVIARTGFYVKITF